MMTMPRLHRSIRFPMAGCLQLDENVMRSLWNPLQSLTSRARNPRRYSIVASQNRLMNFTLLSDELLSNSDRQLAFSGAKVNGIAAAPADEKRRQRKRGRGTKGPRSDTRNTRCIRVIVSEEFKGQGVISSPYRLNDREATLTGRGSAGVTCVPPR